MKKLTALLLALSFALIIPVFSSAQPETQSAPVIARAATHFTCGEMQTGSFGSFPETHSYTVYLQGNKGVAFMTNGAAAAIMKVYAPNGSLVGTINRVGSTSTAYGVLTTPNQSGNYTIDVYSYSSGTYYLNCLTGQGATSNTNTAYNGTKAAAYAKQYANGYNPAYPVFGADCTNFVSQCVYDGGMPMLVGGTDAHWYIYNVNERSPSWAGADYFMRHWTKVRSSGYYGRAREVLIYSKDYILQNRNTVGNSIAVGDVVLYLNGVDSEAYHANIISTKYSMGSPMVFYCSHNNPALDYDWFACINNEIEPTEWIVVIKIRN